VVTWVLKKGHQMSSKLRQYLSLQDGAEHVGLELVQTAGGGGGDALQPQCAFSKVPRLLHSGYEGIKPCVRV
jgi:hypothetical protein